MKWFLEQGSALELKQNYQEKTILITLQVNADCYFDDVILKDFNSGVEKLTREKVATLIKNFKLPLEIVSNSQRTELITLLDNLNIWESCQNNWSEGLEGINLKYLGFKKHWTKITKNELIESMVNKILKVLEK